MKAVILAGGKGSRLKELTGNLPKVLTPINGMPLLEYQILNLKKSGILEIILLLGYGAEEVITWCGDGSKWGVKIITVNEPTPLGTAGSVAQIQNLIANSPFIVVYGDLLFDLDFERLVRFHRLQCGIATLVVHPNDHPYDSDLVVLNEESQIVGWMPKNSPRPENYFNFVNAAVYVFNPEIFRYLKVSFADFGLDIFPQILSRGLHKMFAYSTSEYLKDIGTPDRHKKASEDLKNGIISARSLKNPQRAIFLDRDGTLNYERGHIKSHANFEMLPTAADAIKLINRSTFLAICLTNQPVIARGECTVQDLRETHAKMSRFLGQQRAYLDGLYYCPHHPDPEFPGERKEFKIKCDCRKPAIGLALEAKEHFNIDLDKSWMIGDRTTDIELARRTGMKAILVRTGEAGQDQRFPNSRPDFIAQDVLEAVQWAITESKKGPAL